MSIKNSDSPFLLLELTILKLLEMENSIDLQKLILKIESENNSFKNSHPKIADKFKEPERDINVNEIPNDVNPDYPAVISNKDKVYGDTDSEKSVSFAKKTDTNFDFTIEQITNNWEKIIKKFKRAGLQLVPC